MTERILGPAGTVRKRRMKLVPLLVIAAAILLVGATQAVGAFGDPVSDENGANDVPGQKDLTSQAVDDSGLPNVLLTQWNWDELSTSGNNTLDACSLLDSGTDGYADYAVCATTKGTAVNPIVTTTTLYSCGNTRVDRCASQIAVISPTHTPPTSCVSAVSRTDPYSGNGKLKGASWPDDLRATCTIYLDDLSSVVSTLKLINTCSYPSQQPNSDPSDCVLIPRDAKLIIVKAASGDTTTTFPFTVSNNIFSGNIGAGTALASRTFNIVSGTNYTVAEGTLAGWQFVSGSCAGSNISGGNGSTGANITIKAATADTITCTFTNAPALRDLTRPSTPTVVPQDSVNIGNFDTSGSNDGTLTIKLYSGSGCTGTLYTKTFTNLAAGGTYATDNTGVAATNGYTITSSGTYYWGVSYTGDSRNAAFSDCNESVVATLNNSPSS